MIYGKLKDIQKYKGIHQNVDTAIDWIMQQSDFGAVQAGRNEVAGDDVYAVGLQYTTVAAEESVYEAHLAYADIHIMASGTEEIHVSDISILTETERNEATDFVGYAGECESLCVMKPGDFLLVFPEDAHRVKVKHGEPEEVRRIVVKVKM